VRRNIKFNQFRRGTYTFKFCKEKGFHFYYC